MVGWIESGVSTADVCSKEGGDIVTGEYEGEGGVVKGLSVSCRTFGFVKF